MFSSEFHMCIRKCSRSAYLAVLGMHAWRHTLTHFCVQITAFDTWCDDFEAKLAIGIDT